MAWGSMVGVLPRNCTKGRRKVSPSARIMRPAEPPRKNALETYFVAVSASLLAKDPGDKCPAPMTKHECDALHDRLNREQNTGCCLGAFAHVPHKVRISHVVNIGNQHGDGGGNSQIQNQARNGSFCHFLVVKFCVCQRNDLLSL